MGDRSSEPCRRYSVCNRERAPMRRGRLGSARYGGPYAAGPDEITAALLTGDSKRGRAAAPFCVLIGGFAESCSLGFAIGENSPPGGTPGFPASTNIRFAYWTSGPQRRTATRA